MAQTRIAYSGQGATNKLDGIGMGLTDTSHQPTVRSPNLCVGLTAVDRTVAGHRTFDVGTWLNDITTSEGES